MAIKDKVRGVLINRQGRQYENKLEELRLSHDAWEKNRELEIGLSEICTLRYMGEEPPQPPEPAEGEAAEPQPELPALFCVLYSDIEKFIESGELLKREDGEIVVFARKEGRLSAGAAPLIYRYFEENPMGKLVYGDEDRMLPDGTYTDPFFKPDWSPDTYASAFYIGSIFAVRGSVLKNALLHQAPEAITDEQKHIRGKLLNGLADALFLKLAAAVGGFKKHREPGIPIGHIPEILFHLDENEDLFIGRHHPTARANVMANFFLPMPGVPERVDDHLVTVVIPTKDHPDVLRACLDSIVKTCDSACPYEILIVDNGSTGYNKLLIANFIIKYERKAGLRDIRYIHKPMPFNFSKMCNLGVSEARGDLILLLNDDIVAVQQGWMREMAALASAPHVGAVGAKLIYPADRGEETEISDPRDGGDVPNKIQHAGVTNVRLGPMHKLQYLSDNTNHYFGFNRGVHDLLAVTGACLMIARDRYEEAGGLREEMAVAFNDVDLCYTLYEQGYYNVQCNHVVLEHHESLSRGLDTQDFAKMKRLAGEHRVLMSHHKTFYNFDPFYSIHLVEDEHISEIAPLYEVTQPEEIPFGNISHHAEGLSGIPVDPVVRIGVEYADTLEYWLTGKRDHAVDGYYIKGYAFVIGADNACYDRRLLLRRVEGEETAKVIYSLPANDWYRPDIRDRLKDQIHVDLTGYRVRIGRDELPDGTYQLGMLMLDRTSRQRLVNWVENRMTIGGNGEQNQL